MRRTLTRSTSTRIKMLCPPGCLRGQRLFVAVLVVLWTVGLVLLLVAPSLEH
jgi:hypothetical protein